MNPTPENNDQPNTPPQSPVEPQRETVATPQPVEAPNNYVAPQPPQPQPQPQPQTEPAPSSENITPQQPVAQQPAPVQHNGFAITALVLGILSIVTIFLFPVAILLGLAAVVFGALAMKKHQPKGLAIAGLITGAIGFVVASLFGLMTIVAYQGMQERATQTQMEADANDQEKRELLEELENQQ